MILLILMNPSAVWAQAKSPPPLGLIPEKDTYVNSQYPEENFGAEEKILTSFAYCSEIMFLYFNLDQFPQDQLTSDKRAILNLWLDASSQPLQAVELEILLPQQNWQENELNWNNKPSLYPSELSVVLEATPGAQKIDLTPLLKKWLSGEEKNHGLAFYHSLDTFSRAYFSKENKKNPPSLTIEDKIVPALRRTSEAQDARLNTSITSATNKGEVEGASQPQALNQETQVKGTKTQKSFRDYFGQKTILPLASLWVISMAGFLVKLFKEFPLA